MGNQTGTQGGWNMKNYLGDIIYENRKKKNLTQDQFASKYSVTGPLIFKFEKGHIGPSMDLWLRIAADIGLPQRRAVLLHVKSKLPEEFQDFIEMQSEAAAKKEAENAKKKGAKPDYSRFESREQMREVIERDKTLPKGLAELLADDELWALYRPTGHEINRLRDTFGPLGKGTKVMFREALHLIREFAHSV
jgi:transcriptional regulator with XRE-family HTH domain